MQTERMSLEPGQHSAKTATVKQISDTLWYVRWTARLPTGERIKGRNQAKTRQLARRRAVEAAEARIKNPHAVEWKPSHKLADFVKAVSTPQIESPRLAEASRAAYARDLGLLMGICNSDDHKHSASLKGLMIGSAMRFRTLENCLLEISHLHGYETARGVKVVLGKYVIGQLVRSGAIDHNPLAEIQIDLKTGAKPFDKRPTGKALATEDYFRVVNHLLALKPEAGVAGPKRGRWSKDVIVGRRRNAIDLTLLQAATGLRIGEARQLEWDRHIEVRGGVLYVLVTPEITKTPKGREIPIADLLVAKHLLARRELLPASARYVIGAPSDPDKKWDSRNAREMVADLYKEMSAALNIELMKVLRSHLWRATLNTLTEDRLSVGKRSAMFGHSKEVNVAHYTDVEDVSGMVRIMSELRAEHAESTPKSTL
ncbi:MAG TPA: site-specific integrase [Candidatus Lumbricidophila sp.]|nr:site-specific integrase [Candidatus Lumbricidophila sp.]